MATIAAIFLATTSIGAFVASWSIANEDGDTWLEAVSFFGVIGSLASAVELIWTLNS